MGAFDVEVDKKRKILSLKGARNRASRTRDGPSTRQAALNISINILYGPHALARLARMQREMDGMR